MRRGYDSPDPDSSAGSAHAPFSKRLVAKKLELNFRTVAKYLSMTPEEFEQTNLNRERRRNLSLYEGVVVDWLKKHPDMTAAQVLDWLKEHYQVSVSEGSARRFVEGIRKKYSIPKTKGAERQYATVEDPPMGHQMQVDLGVAYVFVSKQRSCFPPSLPTCADRSFTRHSTGPYVSTQVVMPYSLDGGSQGCGKATGTFKPTS